VAVEIATGSGATRTVDTIDLYEPVLISFVRSFARRIDSTFPEGGEVGPKERGQWTDDEKITTYMQQVEHFDGNRGIRTIRLLRHAIEGGPNEGAVRVEAVGLEDGAQLELRWNIIASPDWVQGTSAELKIECHPAYRAQCIAAFQEQFGDAPPPPGEEELPGPFR